MRRLFGIAFVLAIAVSSWAGEQAAPSQSAPPQTARQALIEMWFGQAPGHFEKHLPDITRQTFKKLGGEGDRTVPGMFSMLAAESKSGKDKIETFDTGSTFLTTKGSAAGVYEKMEITVERDSLVGDEDQIELALHMFKDGKEETLLPFVLRFTVSMKMESEVWRLSQVGATMRLPLEDPAFLKGMEEYQFRQSEEMAPWSVRAVVIAEKSYQSAQGGFACTLSTLGSGSQETGAKKRVYLWDAQLASGKKNGYIFTISGCDKAHYRIAAEPAVPDSGQRAFCSDESGVVRASADGKAATCLVSGEVVPDKFSATGATPESNSASGAAQAAQRIHVSKGISEGLMVTKVPPIYPPLARSARIQGTVVLKAVINKMGDVESLELVSGHPMLAPAAIEAVKQWKYRPYLLNGNAVAVETQVVVNFALSEQ
jgi:TonB family protein